MPRILIAGAVILAVFAALAGVSSLASEVSALYQCRKSCWLNGVLFALFGEAGARYALAALWFVMAGLFAWLAYRSKRGRRAK
jgi:hypothetical protein